MKKQLITTTTALLLICIATALTIPNINKPPTATAQTPDFTIMQISDTQYIAESNPQLYHDLTAWISDNAASFNTELVVHTGDLVNQAQWSTAQWETADTAMQQLNVTYVWCAGNHDQTGMDNPNSGWVGDNYNAFASSNVFSSCVEAKNTAAEFTVDGYGFLVVDVEFLANSEVVAWLTNLLEEYSAQNYNIIVAAHAYLTHNLDFNNYASDGTWETNLQNLLNQYPNVFLTLNGHDYGAAHNTVNGRTQILWDMQSGDDKKGACAVRIYTFNLSTGAVSVSTYSVWSNSWSIAGEDNFVFYPSLKTLSGPTPTVQPTPTASPTPQPTITPTPQPTSDPTVTPTEEPTVTPKPTVQPTSNPTPTPSPTPMATPQPTPSPQPTQPPQFQITTDTANIKECKKTTDTLTLTVESHGYVEVVMSKTYQDNIDDFTVTVNSKNVEYSYSSTVDAWRITFNV